jgi:teichuronic acid biosynthesis glycosyltransferase TuaC
MCGLAARTQLELPMVDGRMERQNHQPAMRVLTLTPFYPTALDDADGCFISEPLRAMEELEVKSLVLAVRPLHRKSAALNASAPTAQSVQYPCIPGGAGLASAGAFLYASLISRVRRIHRSRRINLIHAHAALPCGHAAVLLSRELNIPFVVSVHGLDAFFDNQVHGFYGRWCKRVAQHVYRSASRVICISDKVAERVIEGTEAPVNAKVIYNGVDAQMFSPPASDLLPTTLLSVGNLISIKGHELLLRALAAVLPQHPYVSCEIIGDGPEHGRLARLASDYNISGKVRFLGRQSRRYVADAIRRCTLFALPCRYEGLGCVYLEAMAAERAVIACRGQGIDEIIRHGTNGWLTEPGNLDELITALSVLLQSPLLRHQIGEAARRTIIQSLTLAHQVAELSAVYRECAA